MLREPVGAGVRAAGLALRDPEGFTERWQCGEASYAPSVWITLLLTAMTGTAAYGMTMGILGGVDEVLRCAFFFTLAAGLAWLIPLPAIYILNSFTGSRLSFSSTVLAATVTVSWGGLAMIASIPINWFFTVAVGEPWFVRIVNLVIFTGVGVAMADTFGRVMERLEPSRRRVPLYFLLLVGALGAELFYAFDLFQFAA